MQSHNCTGPYQPSTQTLKATDNTINVSSTITDKNKNSSGFPPHSHHKWLNVKLLRGKIGKL